MYLEEQNLKLLQKILLKNVPQYEILLFGSRMHGKNLKPFSDIDIAIITDKKIDNFVYNDLKESLRESDLPYRVDVVLWNEISDDFRNIIKNNYEILQKPQ